MKTVRASVRGYGLGVISTILLGVLLAGVPGFPPGAGAENPLADRTFSVEDSLADRTFSVVALDPERGLAAEIRRQLRDVLHIRT